MDFAAAGLLDGLEGEARTAREHLLERLAEDGFSDEELAEAVRERRLALLPVDRVLGGTHAARDVEQETGLPANVMVRIRRLHGLSEVGVDDRVFTDDDLEAARAIKMFLDAGFDEERVAEVTRVLGEGMARLAATITTAFVQTFLEPGDTEETVAERFATLAEQLTPAVAPILVAAFKDHLRDSVERGALGREELETGDVEGSQEIAVCFADLVGFTSLGSQVEGEELGTVARKLAELAASVTRSPVRLIKTIGDAAMFVSPEPGPLVLVALDLVEGAEEQDLPSVRAGIALGPAVQRAGDYYGNSVNLASRVTGVARPGSVLCTKEVRDSATDEGMAWSSAGRHRLKGLSAPQPLYRARRADSADEDAGGEDSDEHGAKRPRAGRSRRRARS
jgi:adenylate cyclase